MVYGLNYVIEFVVVSLVVGMFFDLIIFVVWLNKEIFF